MRQRSAFTLVSLSLAVGCAVTPATVAACDFSLPNQLQIVANPADQLPPTSPAVSLVKVQRGDDWNDDGGCGSATSCDGSAFVLLHVVASDDTTPVSELGYLIESTGSRLDVSPQPVRADASGQIIIMFNGSDDGSADVHFQLQVSAVDQAGNISTQPTPFTVTNKGAGCQIARRAPTGMFWCAVLGLAVIIRQRRLLRLASAKGPSSSAKHQQALPAKRRLRWRRT